MRNSMFPDVGAVLMSVISGAEGLATNPSRTTVYCAEPLKLAVTPLVPKIGLVVVPVSKAWIVTLPEGTFV